MSPSLQLTALIATRFLGGVAFQFFIVGGIDALFRESASAFVAGLIGAVLFIPSLLAPMMAGKLLGRCFKPGYLLVATQAGVLLTSAALWVCAETPECIVGAAFLFGVFRAIRSPIQYALMGELRDAGLRAARAARIMSLSWQLPLVLGPLLYSLGTTLVGREHFPAILLLFNMLSLFAALPVLVVKRPASTVAEGTPATSFRQAIYVFLSSSDVAAPLLADAGLNMLLSFTTLLPFLLIGVGHSSSDIGLLRATLNASSLAVALLAPRVVFDETRPLRFYTSLLCLTFVTMAFAFTFSFPLMLLWCALFGAIDGWGVLYRDALLMRIVETRALPSVASVQQVLISASDDLGEWRAGAVAEAVGPRLAMVVSAGIAGIVGLLLLRRKIPLPSLEYGVAWNRDSNG